MLSLGNVSKYEFLTGKDVLPEKDLLKKSAKIKRFEYSLLSKELKAQSNIGIDQYKLLKKQKNNVIDDKREDNDNRKEEYNSGKSNVTEEFDENIKI